MPLVHLSAAARSIVRAMVAAAVAITIAHYADNVLRYDRYVSDDPSALTSLLPAPVVALAGVAAVAAAWWSYRQLVAGHRQRAALGFAALSSSGLASLLHFTEISPADLDVVQAVGIVADFAQGVAMVGLAVWVAWSAPAASATIPAGVARPDRVTS